MLQHLAFPSFVATQEKRIVNIVDESGTHQRPWVRSLVELIEDELPDGPPWGLSAIAQAARFVRPPRKERTARETALLARLRAGTKRGG